MTFSNFHRCLRSATPARLAHQLVLLTFALGLLAVRATTAAEPTTPTNVLLIMTDNQGYFELGCKGDPYLKTPNIDDFAKESVDLCNFHAENFCSPSRAALLTGRQPMRYGVHDTIGGVSLLAANEVTIADRMRAAGYKTGIFGKWHLGMSYPFHPMYRGFDEVFINGGGGIGQLEDYLGNNHMNAHFQHNGKWVPTTGYSSDVLFDRAAQFIKSCGDQAFFCYIPTPAVHFPVQAEPVALARIRKRGVTPKEASLSLLSMIENIDDNVGRLLRKLDEWNLSDNTLVIFMSDQGVGDEGSPKPVWPGKGRKDVGNAGEGKHRVFCMMRKPGLTVAGENQALVCIRDVCPTIFDVCGLEIPDNLDGRSLVPILKGNADWQDERAIVMQCPRNRKRTKWRNAVVKQGDWRLINGDRLYDIASDSLEERNVAALHPDVVARLNAVYDKFWNSLPPEEELLNRHILGAPECPTTQLCAMDWYKGDAPWTQGPITAKRSQGAWAVQVQRGGRYRFELRLARKETPVPIGATSARIRVGQVEAEAPMKPQDDVAILEVDLQPGEYDLETWFQGTDGRSWGALFLDVKYESRS